MAELKTQKTKASVAAFLNAIENDQMRKDCKAVAKLMQEVTGEKPAMWGTSIVGFGSLEYTNTKAGGEWPLTGFSPRKQNLTMYIMPGFAKHQELLAKLGKHSTGQSCLYVKRLADVDLPTLKKLIAESVKDRKRASS
jgi:Domain of unknown function (DU1801)